jgi:poly-gamma-glutamate capsule biosynthesis protein CapA/YwtB (metallophosphatase superfamily)
MSRPVRRVGPAYAVAILSVLLAGCGSGGSASSAQPTPSPPQSPSSPPSPSVAPAPSGPPTPAHPITLAFAGDIHFEGTSEQALSGFGPISSDLHHADLTMANLETAITTRGTATPGKAFTFRAPPSAFAAIRGAGIDVVTMANNHGEDYGPVGLQDTLAAIRSSHFPTVGIGRNEAAAYRPYIATVKGTRVAIVGATDVLDGNLVSAWTASGHHPGLASAIAGPARERLIREVTAARRTADVVVVYLHWGVETVTCPTTEQQSLEHALVAAGADIVVGAHAHVQLGGGWKGRRYVDYGLGNFVFYAAGGVTPETRSGVLTLTVRGRDVTKARWSPALIEDGLPVPLTGEDAEAGQEQWQSLRQCTGLSAHPS